MRRVQAMDRWVSETSGRLAAARAAAAELAGRIEAIVAADDTSAVAAAAAMAAASGVPAETASDDALFDSPVAGVGGLGRAHGSASSNGGSGAGAVSGRVELMSASAFEEVVSDLRARFTEDSVASTKVVINLASSGCGGRAL